VQNAPVCEGRVVQCARDWQLYLFWGPSTLLIDGNLGPLFSHELIQSCQ